MLFLCRLAWGCWKTYHLESRWLRLNSNMYWLYHFCPLEIAKILGSGDRHLLGCNYLVGGCNPKNLSNWIISPAKGEHQKKTPSTNHHQNKASTAFEVVHFLGIMFKHFCWKETASLFFRSPCYIWRFRWLLTTWSCVGGGPLSEKYCEVKSWKILRSQVSHKKRRKPT